MSKTQVQSYIFFGGRCDEALEYYGKTLGAKVEFIMRFKDSPAPVPPGALPPGFENKVMHATIRIGETAIMVSDGDENKPNFAGFALALALPTEGEVDRAFAALADGGAVIMPVAKTFWSPRFGMLTDRFGIKWMVSVAT